MAVLDCCDADLALGQTSAAVQIDDVDIAAGVFGDGHGIASRMYVRVIRL